jgi:FkbM family methyltransferase
MNFRSAIVTKMDKHLPAVIGTLRYQIHVGIRGNVVYPRVTKTLYKRLNSHDATAIDVGANVGIFSRYLCAHFAKVVAVEPIPYLADRLKRSHLRNCEVLTIALGSTSGPVTIRIPTDASGNEMPALSTLAAGNALSFIDKAAVVDRVVQCEKLDTVTAKLDNLAFVKIDVEGFEGEVLKGATVMLAKQRPVLQIEIGRAHNPNYQQVLESMKQANYVGYALQKDGLHADVLKFLDGQPTKVTAADASSPPGCWDYLFVPREKQAQLLTGLVVQS